MPEEDANPKLSVIVPAYNAEAYIGDCLNSLLQQTFYRKYGEIMEILVVDDRSQDHTAQIIRHFAEQYPGRIHAIFNRKNRNVGGARNAGVECARGTYIGFVDSDDICHPDMFLKMYEAALQVEETGGVPCDLVDVGLFREKDGQDLFPPHPEYQGALTDPMRNRLMLDIGLCQSHLYRRAFLLEKGISFREQVKLEDLDYLLLVYGQAETRAVVPEILYQYKNREGSVTKSASISEVLTVSCRTIQAVYDRLSVLPNYARLRNGVEFQMLSFYAGSLIFADRRLQSGRNQKEAGQVSYAIYRLKETVDKIVGPQYDRNPFVDKYMDQERKRWLKIARMM